MKAKGFLYHFEKKQSCKSFEGKKIHSIQASHNLCMESLHILRYAMTHTLPEMLSSEITASLKIRKQGNQLRKSEDVVENYRHKIMKLLKNGTRRLNSENLN